MTQPRRNLSGQAVHANGIQHLNRHTRARFAGKRNVHLYLGDSASTLPECHHTMTSAPAFSPDTS